MTDTIEFGDKLVKGSKGKLQEISGSYVDEERPTPELISVVERLDNATAINADPKGINNILKTFQERKAGLDK